MYAPGDSILLAFFWCWVWFSTVFVSLTTISFVGAHRDESWLNRSPLWWAIRILIIVLSGGGMLGVARVSYILRAANALHMLSWMFGIVVGVGLFIALRNPRSRKDNPGTN